MTSAPASPEEAVAGLEGRRIVIVATGGVGAAFTHSWLGWLHSASPTTEVKVVLTPAATRFVSRGTLHAFGYPPIIDHWDEHPLEPVHVDLAQWAEGYLVHPASMDFVARFSVGLCDSPLLLAMQSGDTPTVLAASAPPGFTSGSAWSQYVAAIKERPNVALLPPMAGFSVADPTLKGLPPVLFPSTAMALGKMLLGGDS